MENCIESGYISDYYNHEFIEEVNKLRPQIIKGGYCMVVVDVKHFKLFNKLYGRKAGNELIRAIYEYLENKSRQYEGVFGYLGADNFALVIKDGESVFNDIKDYIKYRIIIKDGSVRWIEDFGHMENAGLMAENGYYYVFIADITDTITEAQKNCIYAYI